MAETASRITSAFLRDVLKVSARAYSTMKIATLTWTVMVLSIVIQKSPGPTSRLASPSRPLMKDVRKTLNARSKTTAGTLKLLIESNSAYRCTHKLHK